MSKIIIDHIDFFSIITLFPTMKNIMRIGF